MHGDARSTLVMLGVDAGNPDVPLLRPGVASCNDAAQRLNDSFPRSILMTLT